MILAIQIAVGIVIAYVIVVNQVIILKSTKWLFAAVASLAVIAFLIWSISSAAISFAPYVSPFIGKALTILGILPILAIIVFGGYGFCLLSDRLFGKKPREIPDGRIVSASMLNFIITAIILWPFSTITFFADIFASIDLWSRRSGFSDGFSIAFIAIFTLWPYLPLWFIERKRRTARTAQPKPPTS